MAKTSAKLTARRKRIKRIRKKISGTSAKPRMRVFRSNRHISVQIIDDVKRITLVSATSEEKSIAGSEGNKCDKAKNVGSLIAEKALAAGVHNVVLDRGGNLYHGRVQALSEGAREGGLKF
jgi:large subunit ribosomal protein L18